jgi:methyl-accepting chemotaxis protein
MDKVTQQNAASAEESASASEEMNAQAMQMRSIVNELMAMVGGQAATRKTKKQRRTKRPKKVLSLPERATHDLRAEKHSKLEAVEASSEIRPEQVIPLGDDEFKEF